MLAMRHRILTAAVVFAVLASGGAFAYTTWAALFPGDPDIDCDSYVFPKRTWRTALRDRDDPRTRLLARNVARCKLVLGEPRRGVRALLGRPDDLVAGDPEWSYRIGVSTGLIDSDDVYLTITFDRGRATHIRA